MDLSNNHISGEIPSWIWGINLEYLNLSLNLLTHVQKPYYLPTSLRELDFHSNLLIGEIYLPISPNTGDNITCKLQFLSLANNRLNGSIPTSLCGATNLDVLDFSFNRLSGKIPSCLFKNTVIISVFHLGGNNISGHIPDNFSVNCCLQYLDLNNNMLQGKIPKSLQNCEQLKFMNVGNNIINDTFPCMLASSLHVIVLHSNRFHGEVRCQKSWPELQILDISSNSFSGSLESINYSSWTTMGVDNDAKLRYEHLASNFLHASNYYYTVGVRLIMKGLELEIVKILPDFTAIDFACNNFKGKIPKAIGDLRSLLLLNLSHNALNGNIPESFGQLRNLESLDLSENQLTGVIPVELAQLTYLSVLNLSYNKLVGEIPNGRQLQTFLADSFKGNAGLCGFNLNISCTSHTDDDIDEDKDEDMEGIEWKYVFAALGYVVGLGSFVWLLLFC